MSEIKVNKISPRTACGTTTLGDSGDTFTIPAGVSITNSGTASGFGATGAASWNTTVKTGDFTAVNGEGYFVNTTSGEVDVTLPAGAAGSVVAVKDYAKTWDTNNCILISNGSEKIGGSTNNAILSTEGLAVTLVYVDSTQGWLVTDDGLQGEAITNPYIEATGGTITTSGNDKIHKFTGPGTFSVTKIANCSANNVLSHLVIAGGGGGGANHGGGAGAGGLREVVSPSSPYTGSPLNGYPSAPNRVTVAVSDYPITVGGGGAGNAFPPNEAGSRGVSSVFSTITSTGGGGGSSNPYNGLPGGSGGGGNSDNSPSSVGVGNTPPVSPPQGNSGGRSGYGAPNYGMGGGGGAGAAGPCSANTTTGGAGGAGVSTCITASPVAYAGGGGGSTYGGGTLGAGGSGGGGNGTIGGPAPNSANGTAGGTNLGGGGGGGERCVPYNTTGLAGGSGVVIIRYRYQ